MTITHFHLETRDNDSRVDTDEQDHVEFSGKL